MIDPYVMQKFISPILMLVSIIGLVSVFVFVVMAILAFGSLLIEVIEDGLDRDKRPQ